MAEYDIPIKNDLRSAYYDDFHCLAAGCRWSCCKGWHITFDKKDYLSLRHLKGGAELGARMEGAIRRIRKNAPSGHYAEFCLKEGLVCPLLREDGLCDLQIEQGVKALPFVCQSFPRCESLMNSGYFERSLTLGCEGVLGLLWELPDGVYFCSDPLPQKDCKTLHAAQAGELEIHFQEIRSRCIDLLQNRRYPLPQRILLMGLALQALCENPDIGRWLAFVEGMDGMEPPELQKKQEDVLWMYLSNCTQTLLATTMPDPESIQLRSEVMDGLGMRLYADGGHAQLDRTLYLAARERYQELFGDREYFMENVMVSLFFHTKMPRVNTTEELWKSYVSFCNLYSMYRFMAVMSCREGASAGKEELFRSLVMVSRILLHNGARETQVRDEFFQNNSATLAHMAVLLSH